MDGITETSAIELKINELLNTAAVLERLKGWVEPKDHFSVTDSQVTLWPSSEEDSRRYVGALMRAFKAKPRIEKFTNSLTATFTHNGVEVRVWNYKTRKCAVLKKTLLHAAEPEKVIPAKAAWVEEVEELVCEMPAVEAEVTQAGQEVPF